MEREPFNILLAENNAGDVDLMIELFDAIETRCRVHVVRDGVEALAFLRQEGRHTEAPRIDLILLDLNLPKKDGREVLSQIKQDGKLKLTPVLVLTSSQSSADMRICYSLHANGYIAKPADYCQFVDTIKNIELFWLKTVRLPWR